MSLLGCLGRCGRGGRSRKTPDCQTPDIRLELAHGWRSLACTVIDRNLGSVLGEWRAPSLLRVEDQGLSKLGGIGRMRSLQTLQLVPAEEPGGTDLGVLIAVGKKPMLSAFPPDLPLRSYPTLTRLGLVQRWAVLEIPAGINFELRRALPGGRQGTCTVSKLFLEEDGATSPTLSSFERAYVGYELPFASKVPWQALNFRYAMVPRGMLPRAQGQLHGRVAWQNQTPQNLFPEEERIEKCRCGAISWEAWGEPGQECPLLRMLTLSLGVSSSHVLCLNVLCLPGWSPPHAWRPRS